MGLLRSPSQASQLPHRPHRPHVLCTTGVWGTKRWTITRHVQEKEITLSNHHWNDWAGGLTLVLQAIVYIPLLYILLMPWLCLALVKLGRIPFLPSFSSQWPRPGGWLLLGLRAW